MAERGWRAKAAEQKARALAARADEPGEVAAEVAPVTEPEIEVMPPMPDETGESVMPVFEDDPAPPLDVPADLTPWGIFFASLSSETRELLDESELLAAFEAAEKDAREERRRKLKTALAAKAKLHARKEAGLLTQADLEAQELAERNNRRVRWTVQLPFVADTNGVAAEGLCIDGRPLHHGQEVETSWAEWRSCLSIIWNLRQHELDFKGESRLSSLRRMNVAQGTGMSVR